MSSEKQEHSDRCRATKNDRLVESAMCAYLLSCGTNAQWPSSSDCGVVLDGGKRYVVLRKAKVVLAVYEISQGEMLQHLERKVYPQGLG